MQKGDGSATKAPRFPRLLRVLHVSESDTDSPPPKHHYFIAETKPETQPFNISSQLIFLMSAEAKPETQPLTTLSYSSDGDKDKVKDIVLWRRKKLNATVLVAATVTWVLMQVYEFHFLTVISWVAIFIVASIFLYSNMLKLFGKEPPNLLMLELSEETTLRIGNTIRDWIDEAIRWMFLVSAEKDWPVFVGVEAGLLLLSFVGSCMDLLTLVYIGIIVSMLVPLTYVKNEERIKRFVEWLREKYKRCYDIIDEKAIKKIKSRIVNEKKTE